MVLSILPVQAVAEGETGDENVEGAPAGEPLLSWLELFPAQESEFVQRTGFSRSGFTPGETNVTCSFPAQDGKTGTLYVQPYTSDGVETATIAVTLDGAEVKNESDSTQGDFKAMVPLDIGKSIVVTATRGSGATAETGTYTINLNSSGDFPTFVSDPVSDTEKNVSLSTDFSTTKTEYALIVPADEEVVIFNADPDDAFWNPETGEEADSARTFTFEMKSEAGFYDYIRLDRADEVTGTIPLNIQQEMEDGTIETSPVAEIIVTVRDKYLQRDYLFRVVRKAEGTDKAKLPDSVFAQKWIPVTYDGTPHSKDLLAISPLVDQNNLTVYLDNTATTQIEKLETVTDAGSYFVSITYGGDTTFGAVTEPRQLINENGEPLCVELAKKELTVQSSLTNGAVALPYSPYLRYEGIDITGLKVLDKDNSTELQGTWYVNSSSNEGNEYNASASFSPSDPSKVDFKNYAIPNVPLKVTTEARVITSENIDFAVPDGWSQEYGTEYEYNPYNGMAPYGELGDALGGFPMQGPDAVGNFVNYFDVKYVITDNTGNQIGDEEENIYDLVSPIEVGEYKLRVKIKISDQLKGILTADNAENMVKLQDNGQDVDVIYKDIDYKIVKAEINPKAQFQVYENGSGKLEVWPYVVLDELADVDYWKFFDMTFMEGEQSIEPEMQKQYDENGELIGEYLEFPSHPVGTNTLTFTIVLNEQGQKCYDLGSDKVLSATFTPDAKPVTVKVNPEAQIVHTYSGEGNGWSYVPVEELKNHSFELVGVAENDTVGYEVSNINLNETAPGNHDAKVALRLTGTGAGKYYLVDNSVTVPARIDRLSLNDPKVYISTHLENPYFTTETTQPFVPEVSIFHEVYGTIDAPASAYTLTYQNNILPSVEEYDDNGNLVRQVTGKVFITAAADGPLTGAVMREFIIRNGIGYRGDEAVTEMNKGDSTQLYLRTKNKPQLKCDDETVIQAAATDPVNGYSTITVTAKGPGEAILMVKTDYENYDENDTPQFRDGYQVFGFIVSDSSTGTVTNPSSVFVQAIPDTTGAMSSVRTDVSAQVGTGTTEDEVLVKPVTITGSLYPTGKTSYGFKLNAVSGYAQADGYKVVTDKNIANLTLSGATQKLDENVTNGRHGMSKEFAATNVDDIKALNGTYVRLQWYQGTKALGQPETYKLDLSGLKYPEDYSITSVTVKKKNETNSEYDAIADDITATVDNTSNKITLVGKKPTANSDYRLDVVTSLGGALYPEFTLKVGGSYEFTDGTELNSTTGFYLLNKVYTLDISGLKELTQVAAPAASAQVSENLNLSNEMKQELTTAINQSTSSVTAAVMASDQKDTILNAAPNAATEEQKTELKTAIIAAGGSFAEGTKVQTVVQPYLDIAVTNYSDGVNTGILSLNIAAKCQTVATTAANPTQKDAVKLEGKGTNAVKIGNPVDVTVTTPITITLKLPQQFVENAINTKKPVYVKHTKGVNSYYYPVTFNAKNNTATFTSQHGLSPFEISLDFEAEASVHTPGAAEDAVSYYKTLKEAVEKAKSGDEITVYKNPSPTTFTASIDADKTLTFIWAGDGEADELTINEVKVKPTTGGKTVTIKKSGGGTGTNPNPNPGTGSDVGGGTDTPSDTQYTVNISKTEHGTVKADSTTVVAGSPVTLTVTPDKGYKLSSITVTDSKSNAVTVTEKNGKYSFVMPEGNVTVEAKFVEGEAEASPEPSPSPFPSPDPSPSPSPDASPSPSPWKNPFPDVKEGQWYMKAVEFVVTRKLMVGYPNGSFEPQGNITRAEFAQIIYSTAGRPGAGSATFTDVKAGAWYATPVSWAADQKIVSGVGHNQFAPNREITREQLATMLWAYAGRPEPTQTTLNFSDADKASSYAKKALLWANENKVMGGKGNGILDAKGKATRAETAQMVMSFINR